MLGVLSRFTRQTDRQADISSSFAGMKLQNKVALFPPPFVKFQRENLLNFLPGSRIYILSPPRKD